MAFKAALRSRAPVYASLSGYVDATNATYNGCTASTSPGRYVQIDHGTVDSRYHHLSSVVVQPGQWVATGQLIGYEGQTGNACAEHLHVEWRNDATRQPLVFNNDIFNTSGANKITAGSPIAFHGQWHLNASADSAADKMVYFGDRGDIPVSGDWNGDGRDSPGFVRVDQATGDLLWYLSNVDLAAAAPNTVMPLTYAGIRFGVDGDYPVPGDWNGDDVDTPGISRVNTANGLSYWWLTNNVTAGAVHIVTPWGSPGRIPVAGDWNADGVDTPGIYWPEGRSWWLTNTAINNGSNALNYTPFQWGLAYDVPMAGDWATINVDRPMVYQKANALGGAHTWFQTDGLPGTTYSFANFGVLSDYPMVLNWDGDVWDDYAVLR
jgi:hypothetical protein